MTSRNKPKIKKQNVVIDVIPVVNGLGMGPAYHYRKFSFTIEDFNYPVENVETEITRVRKACKETAEMLLKTKKLSDDIYSEQFSEIFESQIALLEDTIFLEEIENLIKEKNSSAAYAVFTIFREKMNYFMSLENEYFRDRALDIQDLKHKILQSIFGMGEEYQISIPSVVFAEFLSPADTIHFNRNLILGIVTDTGGKTSHAAIVARSLHLPYVLNEQNLSQIVRNEDFVIIDGYDGKLVLNPSEQTIVAYKEKKRRYEEIEFKLQQESNAPTITIDGIHVNVMANVEFAHELTDVKSCGANGIGLFRTEGLFLEKDGLPTEEEQFRVYRRFSEEMKGTPVILRTLDSGGDKILKDIEHPKEQNPFLGWRAIRFCIDEREIFKTQLRAVLRANVNNNIKILLPMVSCLREIRETKIILDEVRRDLSSKGDTFYPDIDIGIMVEIPAAALLSDIFAQEVDFLSFGTNDLTQYTLAVDRTNQKISRLFNDMHPAIIRMMQITIQNAHQLNKEISICGEMAANPEAIPILIGLGLRQLSLSPDMIPRIKKIIRSCSLTDCENLVKDILQLKSAMEIEESARQFFSKKFSGVDLLT